MANWACGTLRIRGKEKDVVRFMCEGFECTKDKSHPVCKNGVIDCWEEDYLLLDMDDDVVYAHALWKPAQADYEKYVYATVDVEVKGGFRDACHLLNLARKYNVDFRLRIIESGNAIDHSIEIINGVMTLNCDRTYENFIWECDMPNMGY